MMVVVIMEAGDMTVLITFLVVTVTTPSSTVAVESCSFVAISDIDNTATPSLTVNVVIGTAGC